MVASYAICTQSDKIMTAHYIMPLLSSEWYWGITTSLVYILCGIFLMKALDRRHRQNVIRFLGFCILGFVVFTQYYFWQIADIWDIRQSLPLQMCDLSLIICGIALISGGEFPYEWALLVGLPSAIHSILTPEFTRGYSSFLLFEFYFSHATQILSPLVLTLYLGMRPRLGSWVPVFLAVNVTLVVVLAFNIATGANYIYLLEKPAVENPLLIGPWLWYILGVEIAGLLHILLFYYIFRKTRWFAPKPVLSGETV